MPDLDDAFRAFQTQTLARIRPVGLAEARRRSRRRRQRQAATVAVLVLLAVVLPFATYAAAPRHATLGGPDRVPGWPPTVSASGLPSWEPESPPATLGYYCPFDPSLQPDPASTMGQICDATINVPPWPTDLGRRCVSGPLAFSNGAYWNGSYVITFGPMYGTPALSADVDGDGVPETIVVIVCNVVDDGQTAAGQVVVLKPAPGGGFATFGRVVLANEIFQIAVTGSGEIQVNVGQWRTYAWNGTGFVEMVGAPAPSGSDFMPGEPTRVSSSGEATSLPPTGEPTSLPSSGG